VLREGFLTKIVISDQKTGKCHQIELEPSRIEGLVGKKIGDEIEGGFLGLGGYQLRLSGGTDKQGFPMRPGIHKTGRSSLLLKGGQGVSKLKGGVRRRKTVAGEIVSDNLEQLNMVIVKEGKTPLEQILKKEVE
jgi:small subunit ribosomal protein S6e